VQEIDSHVELVDLEITNNQDTMPHTTPSPHPDPAAQLAMDVSAQPAMDTVPSQPKGPVA